MSNIIEINNLTKCYGQHRGVIDVNLNVKQGEVFGFLGPNGAGKSTTIRSMLGLIKADSGTIKILGMDSVRDREEILKNIGYMPSEAWFYPGMTIGEVLKLSADVRKTDCTDEMHMLCERFQVDSKRIISELSLGNRKKVSIIAAMQHKPKLFIFDEPTSGLDPLMQGVFFDCIREYVEKGASCMLSTHILPEARNHCDSVAIMKEGRLIVTDTVENLLASHSKRIKMIRDGEKLDYIYKGNLNDIYKEFKGHDIDDLIIEEPSIEEVFMQYYQKEENDNV